ncbi:hypothetical protein L1987_45804 [Smallanthus sonchifolius]|uniref:Uncharacterized protein n=1 Tax=Smallanthus sonchifolius TaxID=185202 RepID=A0ACB9FY36_9ASTR|nr:hypothetical protein L1987_45804 [Smallanthus sonchifolius]
MKGALAFAKRSETYAESKGRIHCPCRKCVNARKHVPTVVEDASKKPRSIVDVGCGIGGSSRYLSRKYGAECYGITLNPVQAERAQSLAAAQGLANKVIR